MTECAICYDNIGDTNRCITPCGHSFCCNCIMRSTQYNSGCPCCRAELYAPREEEEEEDSDYEDEDENEYDCRPEDGSFDREGYHKLPITIEDPARLHWIIEYFPPDTYTQDYMDQNSFELNRYNSFLEIQKIDPMIQLEDVFDEHDRPSENHANFHKKKQEKCKQAVQLLQRTRSIMAVMKNKLSIIQKEQHKPIPSGLVLTIPRTYKKI